MPGMLQSVLAQARWYALPLGLVVRSDVVVIEIKNFLQNVQTGPSAPRATRDALVPRQESVSTASVLAPS